MPQARVLSKPSYWAPPLRPTDCSDAVVLSRRISEVEGTRTELTYGQAFLVGCAQALAIVPGISRSGSTIASGVLLGLDPGRAARFSFLLSIPAILGAAVLGLPDALEEGTDGSLAPILWAALLAGFVGWGALRMLLAFLGRGAFAWFAIYCTFLGTGALIFS